MECKHCKSSCIKAGHSRGRIQRYRCNTCNRYQQGTYTHQAYNPGINQAIVQLLTEGLAIRGIARFLKISTTTVVARIKSIAKEATRKPEGQQRSIYEIDELWTYVGKKDNEVWITYAIDRISKKVVDFVVGPRTKERLSIVTAAALALTPLKICTDGLSVYKFLIPSHLHSVGLPYTRRIERSNLNLRTHLKRLSRKTICFSKSLEMLESCLRIYFWG